MEIVDELVLNLPIIKKASNNRLSKNIESTKNFKNSERFLFNLKNGC